MSKLFLRAALIGCAAAGMAVAQTPPTTPYSVPVTGTTAQVRATPPAPAKMVLKSFDVADLVCPPADSSLADPGHDPAMVAAAKAFADVRSEELLKAVRAATDRAGWDESGGAGKMALTTDGKALVVNNTAAEVDKVKACVESLRRLRSAQVKVDMVVFTVPSGNEAMVKLFGDKGQAAVSSDEMSKMLRELKASGAADIITRPTLILTNKQTGFCQVGEQVPLPQAGQVLTHLPVGMTTRVTPDVSADLKSFALAFEFEHRETFGGPLPGINCQQGKANVVLPDGGCMAVKVCTRKVDQKVECKVPVVGDLPCVGQLFRTTSTLREPTDTVAVITATRVYSADLAPRPPVAAVPPMMPVAARAMPAPTPLMMPAPVALPQPVPVIRTVGPDGLERVGVDFTCPAMPMPTPTAVPVAAVIGSTSSSPAAMDDTTALMGAYKAACAAGKKDEATRLALQLLAKDPTCFGKK